MAKVKCAGCNNDALNPIKNTVPLCDECGTRLGLGDFREVTLVFEMTGVPIGTEGLGAKCTDCDVPVPFEKDDHPGVRCVKCFDLKLDRMGSSIHGTPTVSGPPRPKTPYQDIGRAIGELVAEKQAAYGDSFGKSGAVIRILYPDGIPLEKLDDGLTVIRVLDKLFRIATDRDALGEDPWRDIAGYAVLSIERKDRG